MELNAKQEYLVSKDDIILVTGANGFIGSRVVRNLLSLGFSNIRCLVRSGKSKALDNLQKEFGPNKIELVKGNLLSRETCATAAANVSVVYHLAAGIDKTFPGCFLNSVVATRNLLDAVTSGTTLKRFVNV